MIVAAGLILWFASSFFKVAIGLGAVGGALLFGSSCAFGYETLGKEKVQAEWDADKKARQEHLSEVIVERGNAITELEQKAREQRVALDQRYDSLKKRHDALAARLDAVSVAGVVLDSLRDTVTTTNAAMAGLAAEPTGTATPSADASGSAVDGWFQVVAKQYALCVKRVADVTAAYDKQRSIN